MDVVGPLNSALRRIPAWPIYVISLGYAGWLLWLGIENRLGAEPVKALEHALGEAALYLLVAGLAVTPLRRHAGVNLLKYRRAIGLACFFFVTVHLLTWAVLDVQRLDRVWADILKRPYITVGMVAFVALIPLAVTSNNWSVRRLGGAVAQAAQAGLPDWGDGGGTLSAAGQGLATEADVLSGVDTAFVGLASETGRQTSASLILPHFLNFISTRCP